MIKNNFKILKEERDHILSLVRLPNHKEPISLLEQVWPAEHLPLDPNAESKGSADKDVKIIFQNMQLNGDPTEIYTKKLTSINNQIIDRIQKYGFRSNVFGQFENLLDSLIIAKPEYKSYYEGEKNRFKDAVSKGTTYWSEKLGITHDPLTDPDRDDVANYDQDPLNYKYFPGYFKSIEGFLPSKGDVTKESTALDCKACIDATRNYVNKILSGGLNNYQTKEFQDQLKACWNKYENPNDKTIFGRYKRGKQCEDKGEAKRVYKQFIIPLLTSSIGSKSKIDGVTIDDKYKIDIQPSNF
jgi:hypothetical protein